VCSGADTLPAVNVSTSPRSFSYPIPQAQGCVHTAKRAKEFIYRVMNARHRLRAKGVWQTMHILILGGGGMLGHTMVDVLSGDGSHQVTATYRSIPEALHEKKNVKQIKDVDLMGPGMPERIIATTKPDFVVNCVGIIKQLDEVANAPLTIYMNALLPHLLSQACAARGARLLHLSTDCVFDGVDGGYTEDSRPNATDLYGKSKHLGEVTGSSHALTLRTSIIGHEIGRAVSLVDWFLSQFGKVRGFRNAIYTGLPTVELANIVRDIVIPNPDLSGLYQVASTPINKYDLLCLVRERYRHEVEIEPDYDFVLDRSLNADAFRAATGYVAPEWPELVDRMYQASPYSQHTH